jgi:hypothetical protein
VDIEQTRAYLAGVERTRSQFLAATRRPDPFAEKVKGAIFAMVAPRLALDAQMPDLDLAVAGVDRGNFHSHRKHIADSVRRAVKGRLGRDADVEDIEQLLEALEREEGEDDDMNTSYDTRRHHGRDAEPVERPGFGEPEPPEDDPWSAEDAELEELKGQMSPEAYDRLRRRAADRRQGRDTPYRRFDSRRRTGRDDPLFPGAPRTGGGMYPMENETVQRPGFGEPRDVGARDKRRRYGADAKPGFSDRFGFTRSVTDSSSSSPIKVAVG